MDQDILNKRIAVAGIGGVGGYLAGMLGRVCPHLTMAVRGDRRESILKNGLVLHSEYKGEINVRPEDGRTGLHFCLREELFTGGCMP